MGRSAANTVRVARAAAARVLTAELVLQMGRALLIGAVLALALVGVAKFCGLKSRPVFPWVFLVATPLVLAVPTAAAYAAARRWWPMSRAARELDARLGLKDVLATGLALAGGQDAFSSWAVEEAERASARVSVA